MSDTVRGIQEVILMPTGTERVVEWKAEVGLG